LHQYEQVATLGNENSCNILKIAANPAHYNKSGTVMQYTIKFLKGQMDEEAVFIKEKQKTFYL